MSRARANFLFTIYFILKLVFTPMIAGTTDSFGPIFTHLWMHSVLFKPFVTLTIDFGCVAPLVTSVLAPVGLKHVIERASRKEISDERTNIRIYVGAMIILLILLFIVAILDAITGSWANPFRTYSRSRVSV